MRDTIYRDSVTSKLNKIELIFGKFTTKLQKPKHIKEKRNKAH